MRVNVLTDTTKVGGVLVLGFPLESFVASVRFPQIIHLHILVLFIVLRLRLLLNTILVFLQIVFKYFRLDIFLKLSTNH